MNSVGAMVCSEPLEPRDSHRGIARKPRGSPASTQGATHPVRLTLRKAASSFAVCGAPLRARPPLAAKHSQHQENRHSGQSRHSSPFATNHRSPMSRRPNEPPLAKRTSHRPSASRMHWRPSPGLMALSVLPEGVRSLATARTSPGARTVACKNPDHRVLAEALAVGHRMTVEVLALQRTKKKAQVVDLLGPFGLQRRSLNAVLVEPAGIEPASASHHRAVLHA